MSPQADMLDSPEPLTRRQKIVVACVAFACAATRFAALARSLWDWDEALFVLGMRDYNVALHQPHPPGFPVYIALAKVVRLVVSDDFRALQVVNLLAAMLVFPALFFFARQLRLRFEVALTASALFAFLPNVWFFGGGAFSDVPSIVLVLFAAGLLFRGAHDRNAYWLGTLLLALSIGIRPQNLLLGLYPGLYATRSRRPREVIVAFIIGLTVVVIAFGGAMYATGSADDYLRAVREHGDYISRIDSWRSPVRPPMLRLFDRFFVKQYQSPALSIVATLFVLISMTGSIRERSRPMLRAALTFVPFAIVAWMMLDRFSVSRFSIGYQPMFAIFAADGIRRTGAAMERTMRLSPGIAARTIAVALTAAFIAFTLPALTPVRNETAPPLVAARAVVRHVDPSRDHLYVAHTMTRFVDLVTPRFPYTRVLDERAMPLTAPAPHAWLLTEVNRGSEEGFVFKRERGNLWNIARRHYFEVKLQPMTAQPRFDAGWYGPELDGTEEWRWMSGHSTTLLPPVSGRAMLRLQAALPSEITPHKPRIVITLNGRVLGQFRTTHGYFERDYRVAPAPRGLPNVLQISVDRTTVPAREQTGADTRTLGLRLRYLSWGPY